VSFINKYIKRLLISILIIISLYNIFSILIISYSPKIEGYFSKTINYLPYKHSIFFVKPLIFKKKDIQNKSISSKKLYNLISKTEKKSALDYTYWEVKILHQINNNSSKIEFEKNFINLFVLSKNNKKKNKSLKLYYLRNIPRFSNEVGSIIIEN
tara:strand:- start:9168 stop:9632 length:465 start_codon:yes stop_codon:yes gene_type:complete